MDVARLHVFETNSSSSHVICILKNCEQNTVGFRDDDGVFLYDGRWNIDVSEGYGWGFEILTTFGDKFKYALCEYCSTYFSWDEEDEENLKMLEDIAKRHIPGLRNIVIDNRIEYKESDDGHRVEYEVPNIGTIAHQRACTLKDFLAETVISLEEFLVNDRYIIVVDNDNTDSWDDYKKSGIINLNNIESEYRWE